MKLSNWTVALLAVVALASTASFVHAADLSVSTAHQVFTDDKGHYRLDWAAGNNRPAFINDRLASLQNRDTPTVSKTTPASSDQQAPYSLSGQSKDAPTAPEAVQHYNDKGRLIR